MGMTAEMQEILAILAQNVRNNPKPQVVDTLRIAAQLGMNVRETKQILGSMQAMGVVMSSADCTWSLITPMGMRCQPSEQWLDAPLPLSEGVHDQASSLSF